MKKARSPRSRPPSPALRRKHPRLLIVDDEALTRDATKLLLECHFSARVVKASCNEQALRGQSYHIAATIAQVESSQEQLAPGKWEYPISRPLVGYYPSEIRYSATSIDFIDDSSLFDPLPLDPGSGSKMAQNPLMTGKVAE
jgi:hypothetical protein